jgi:hypothetical protein
MKNKLEELDVDIIGGYEKLTKDEEIALRDYFAKRQEIKSKILRIIANRTKKKSTPKFDQA